MSQETTLTPTHRPVTLPPATAPTSISRTLAFALRGDPVKKARIK